MGLFGLSKIKIDPTVFVKSQIDNIFSENFVNTEKRNFAIFSRAYPILQKVNFFTYIKERQNAIRILLFIAWCQTAPRSITDEIYDLLCDDARIKELNFDIYHCCLSAAQAAGMSTFGYITKIFLTQIFSPDTPINPDEYHKIYVLYGSDYTTIYDDYKDLIKKYKFVR